MGAPHVFVAWTDLKRLACDAWLVPGGKSPGNIWRDALPMGWHLPALAALFEDEPGRTVVIADLPGEPLAVLTDITGTNRHLPSWYVDGAREFVRTATERLRASRAPLHGRARYLLALPLLGTQGGGAAQWSGEITSMLLPALREEAQQLEAPGVVGIDVALVLIEGPAWAAAQRARRDDRAAFAALPVALQQAAEELAERAREGGLTVFMGAGIAKPAGLPGWQRLLHLLAAEHVGVDELAAFDELSELDRAALIERRLDQSGGETLGQATARVIAEHSRRIAIGHALLAGLPVREVVTTNYDDLFERASAVVGRPCARVPGSPVLPGQRFILKMHGCVTRPSTIVLSRRDYLRFQENRSALAGIVQALLLTRHMLFVGFSFTDDNFHRIAHAVRSAMRGDGDDVTPRAPFGTNLVVGKGGLVADLWRDELRWLALSAHEPSPAEQARLAEIFLDHLGACAATVTAHLGDVRWDGALTAGERQLKTRLGELVATATTQERATPAWTEVERLLARLGMKA